MILLLCVKCSVCYSVAAMQHRLNMYAVVFHKKKSIPNSVPQKERRLSAKRKSAHGFVPAFSAKLYKLKILSTKEQ